MKTLSDAMLESLRNEKEIRVGTVVDYFGPEPRDGWLWCDGAEHDIDDWPELYEIIADKFGGDDDRSRFRVPDYRGMELSFVPPLKWYQRPWHWLTGWTPEVEKVDMAQLSEDPDYRPVMRMIKAVSDA